MNERNTPSQPVNILLVEDNDDDVVITRHVFSKVFVPVELHVANDGVEALRFLRREAPYTDAPAPALILVDLNMPRMDGRQLLTELKRDENLKMIPAIVLTTSAAEIDVCNAYRSHASAYVTKPIDLQEFSRRIQSFASFWLGGVAQLPSAPDAGSTPDA